MTVLPDQKLSVGELFVSLAAGLMFFLLPNDAKNQFNSPVVSESFVMLMCFVITATLYLIIKRFEAIGAAMLCYSVLVLSSMVFGIINGIFSKTKDYWPSISEYNLVCMFVLWIIPFFFTISIRLLSTGNYDTNKRRRGFSRFLILSMRALLIIYGLSILFKIILPYKPKLSGEREIDFIIFNRIGECITNIHENGTRYILWHSFIFVPLTFYLLILVPQISWWHLLIISFSCGFALEILQYSLNTGSACIDDIIMYIIGAMIGVLLKHLIDSVRSVLTFGEDKCMLSYNYTPLKKKSKLAEPIIEE